MSPRSDRLPMTDCPECGRPNDMTDGRTWCLDCSAKLPDPPSGGDD